MTSNIIPKKLAIYYSYPSLVNGSNGNISSAVTAFSAYDLVVLGDGLQLSTHPDHLNTVNIINDPAMANTTIFGYIDTVQPLDAIQDKIDQWYNMGIKGIFMDKFGYDYGVTRQQQREIIWWIHNKGNGLLAFVNAWNPDDVFGAVVDPVANPNGLTSRINSTDWYLAESFAVINGVYDDNDTDNNNIKDFQDKAFKMTNYKTTFGTNMAAITTLGSQTFTQNLANYSYFLAVLNKFDAWGFGEEYFSSSSALLPFRMRVPFHGTKFTAPITIINGVMEHQTNVGIHVDTNAHTVDLLLD